VFCTASGKQMGSDQNSGRPNIRRAPMHNEILL
jgi:hypothetical protein